MAIYSYIFLLCNPEAHVVTKFQVLPCQLNCARQPSDSKVRLESDSNPPDITLLCRITLSASVPPGKVVARSANAQLSIELVVGKLCKAVCSQESIVRCIQGSFLHSVGLNKQSCCWTARCSNSWKCWRQQECHRMEDRLKHSSG